VIVAVVLMLAAPKSTRPSVILMVVPPTLISTSVSIIGGGITTLERRKGGLTSWDLLLSAIAASMRSITFRRGPPQGLVAARAYRAGHVAESFEAKNPAHPAMQRVIRTTRRRTLSARSELARLDEKEPEEIAKHRDTKVAKASAEK